MEGSVNPPNFSNSYRKMVKVDEPGECEPTKYRLALHRVEAHYNELSHEADCINFSWGDEPFISGDEPTLLRLRLR